MVTGVETERQLSFLQAQDCSEAQGHLFSPPIGADELTALLGNWHRLVKDEVGQYGRLEEPGRVSVGRYAVSSAFSE